MSPIRGLRVVVSVGERVVAVARGAVNVVVVCTSVVVVCGVMRFMGWRGGRSRVGGAVVVRVMGMGPGGREALRRVVPVVFGCAERVCPV